MKFLKTELKKGKNIFFFKVETNNPHYYQLHLDRQKYQVQIIKVYLQIRKPRPI